MRRTTVVRAEVTEKMALSGGAGGGLLNVLLRCCARAEESVLRLLGVQPVYPALAVPAPLSCPSDEDPADNAPSFLDGILWMAAPKSRRTIEVNRCRRRNPNKLMKKKKNIDVCPECGHVKLKHVLCGVCYTKVRHETLLVRKEIQAVEGGPFKAPVVESVVLYEGEKPHPEDEGRRIIERKRKRPSWFSY